MQSRNAQPSIFQTSIINHNAGKDAASLSSTAFASRTDAAGQYDRNDPMTGMATDWDRLGSGAAKGILIGMLSAFASAILVVVVLGLLYFFRYTSRGRIFLDRISRPGEFDDEQAFAKEEAEALETMDDIQRTEYMRAKAFIQANPPESANTDISLSQFLAIQEKGVSAWEFEPELEIANCFVEGRTEIEFFDSECSVQTNLPMPKQNEVYYWEAKIYEKPESTTIGIGVTTKPYPLFRLPGHHKSSVAYISSGDRRFNQPFSPTKSYGPTFVHGDVIGCGYRPRTGTIFFTRNGKKLEDVTHTLKTQNLFPTIGATGPCQIHVNFGQMGFVFIEAQVKKWGLAPMTGSLAPPPPYGSEAGSVLLGTGQHGIREGEGFFGTHPGSSSHNRSWSAQMRLGQRLQRHPNGPQRSPTDISLAQLSLSSSHDVDSNRQAEDDAGEGRSASGSISSVATARPVGAAESGEGGIVSFQHDHQTATSSSAPSNEAPPPDYESPDDDSEHKRLLSPRPDTGAPSPPIPSYDAAVGSSNPSGTSSQRLQDRS